MDSHAFSIDLLSVDLGSFDVVIGMDWLSANQAEVICHEKLVRIPLSNKEVLTIRGETGSTQLKTINMMKAQKFLRKGYPAFLARIVNPEVKERKFEEIPIVREYPEVFPEELPGLPPSRQLEF